jgi:hypothetical protein
VKFVWSIPKPEVIPVTETSRWPALICIAGALIMIDFP